MTAPQGERRALRPALLVVAALLMSGCAADDGSSDPSATVTVFAAASLTGAFTEIAEQFEAENPGTAVTLSFGASSSLAQQIVAGAPADVFASASPATMQLVAEAGQAADPRVFARNRLEIAVPAGNPGKVTVLADFAEEELTLALCAPEVPCGAAAAAAFTAAGIEPAPDTLEQDVKAALSKVVLGEVDAALVYRTDVLAAGEDVVGIAFPEAEQVINDYPLTVLTGAPHEATAAAFVEHVLSSEGQRVLADAGFDSP